jgi:hypothetical protein
MSRVVSSLACLLLAGVAHANPVPMFGGVGPAAPIGGAGVLIVAVPPYTMQGQRPVLPNGGIRDDALVPNTWDVPPGPRPWLSKTPSRPTAWQSQPTRVENPGEPVAFDALETGLKPVDSLPVVENHLPSPIERQK